MKVAYHQVVQPSDTSFRVLEVRGSNHPCSWHFHPEFQLGLLLSGSGHRIVGDDIAPIAAGDLSLLGPNLPHVWQFEKKRTASNVHAIIVYFREDSLGADFFQHPEASAIRRLLKRCSTGIAVKGRTRREVSNKMQELVKHSGFQRIIDLLDILHRLSVSEELLPICSAGFTAQLPDVEGERLQRVCAYIQDHIAEPIKRDDAAATANLSPGAFSRFFKARTGKTFHEFVNELRVGRACRLLSEHEMNVTEVAFACGFSNVASFNRTFRREKNQSPTAFRRHLQTLN